MRRLPGYLAVLLTASTAWGQAASWWNFKWPYRRLVTAPNVPATGYPGDEVAVVTMPTCGKTRADGGGVRVMTGSGSQLSHRVLMVGPGDRIRVAFALRRGITRYYVYFGNPDAKAPTPLSIRRGVLLETWAYPGRVVRNLRQAERIFAQVTVLIGRDFIDRVFIGHNPFGPQRRVCSTFTGWLICRTSGEYEFATSSQDASFLTIDGKLVVSNGGRHRPQRVASRRGTIRLGKGLHELKLYHLNGGGYPVATAAWKPPGAKRPWPIPPSAFAPVVTARPGLTEQYGKGAHADFIPTHAGEAFMADMYFQRYTFQAMFKGTGQPKYHWRFGDGQTSTAAKVDHVYLKDGRYEVTLTARVAGQTIERTNRIYVSRPWARVTSSRLDALADHARIVSAYDFTTLDASLAGRAIALFERAKLPQAILKAGDALVKRDSAPAASLDAALPAYAEALVADGASDRATAALLKGAEMTRDPAVGAKLIVLAGETALKAGDPDRAMAIFTKGMKKYSALTTGEYIRRARVGIGDVWRIRGDYKKALAAYQAAPAVSQVSFEKQAVRKGDLARHAEDYIRRRMYGDAEDYLDKWEYEFPVEKLEGFSSLVRVRLELARRRPTQAAEHAELLVRVNPRSNYAAELLLLASEAYRKLGRRDVVRSTLQRIVKGYPESPLAAEAEKKIKDARGRP